MRKPSFFAVILNLHFQVSLFKDSVELLYTKSINPAHVVTFNAKAVIVKNAFSSVRIKWITGY